VTLRLLRAAALLLLVMVPAANAGSRVALVIGNGKYEHTTPLANPSNDARGVAQALSRIGFQVVELRLDLSFNQFRDELRKFSEKSRAAEVALVFFAGHGMELGGKNYLVPTDARLKSDQDVEWEVVPLDLVLTAIRLADLQIVVLDACRNNPLAARMVVSRGAFRSVPQGLAAVEPRGNTLIAYAAKAGSFALDGDSSNSPFTSALLQHMSTPGVEIRIMFGKVRDSVLQTTKEKQEPFIYGSIGGTELYLVPRGADALAAAAREGERALWNQVHDRNDAGLLKLYLEVYPRGEFAGIARQKLREMEARTAALPPAKPPLAGRDKIPTFTGELAIATAGPMTGSFAMYGAQFRAGAQLAVDDINARGGVLGKKLRLVVEDDGCDPKRAVAVAAKLAAEKIPFVAGHFCSGSSIPASTVYEEGGTIMITPASSNPTLTEQGKRNVFRVSPRDDGQASYAAQYLARAYRDKAVGIIHDGTVYGLSLVDVFKKALNAFQKKEAFVERYARGDKDYSALVARIKAANIDFLYLGGFHTEAAVIVRQMREAGATATVIGPEAMAEQDFWNGAGNAGEGTLVTFMADPRKFLEAADVVERFRARNIEPDGYVLYTYATVQAWAEAADRAKSTDAHAVGRVLGNGRFTTALGTMGFDAKGDVTLPGFAMYEWRGGKLEQLVQ